MMNSVVTSKHIALLVCAAFLALPTLMMAQAGSLDPTFGTNGIATTANSCASTAALQSDGKIVVAGAVATSKNPSQPGLLRYNTNGTLDTSFGTGGQVIIAPNGSNSGPAFAIGIQSDGKILVAAPSNLDLEVFRFNTNGSTDSTFGSNGLAEIEASGLFLGSSLCAGGQNIVVQSDGKILVAAGILVRLLSNGQLDSTFGSSGAAATTGGGLIALLPNGEILLSSSGGLANGAASLYTANGSLDTTFGITGQAPGYGFSGAIGLAAVTNTTTNTTKFITSGSLVTSPSLNFGSSTSGFLLARYNSNGTLDNAFGSHGGVTTPFPGNVSSSALAVAIQSNGDIVAGGRTAASPISGPSDFALARYTSSGKLDTTFGSGGLVTTAFGSSVASINTLLIQTDGKIVAVGNSNSGTTIARYLEK